MDSKQIITLAVIFVAGLVLGNLAGNVTGYGIKTTSISLSEDTIKVDTNKAQMITITVKPGETIKKDLGIYNAGGKQRLSGSLGTIGLQGCSSSTCSAGKEVNVVYTIPTTIGNYYVIAYNKANNEVGRAYFNVQ